jgi:cytochrome c556
MVHAKRIPSRVVAAELHEVTRDHVVFTWRNVTCAVFKRETTLGGVRTIQRVYDDLAGKFPEGVLMVTIVEEGAPMPVVEVRDALAKFLASGAGRSKMSAVIHEGIGFRAAAVRAVVTGLAMVAKLPYPHKVFATPTDAARWFSLGDQPFDADDFVTAVADARARAWQHPGAASSQGV